MKILITGGTGLIGQAVVRELSTRTDQEVMVLSRRPKIVQKMFGDRVGAVSWDDLFSLQSEKEPFDGLIHLAGESIAALFWAEAKKRRIRDSRVLSGQKLVEFVGQQSAKPRFFIQASAIGYYGNRGEEILTETAAPGSGFLSDVCQQWEASTAPVEKMGVRRVIGRIGVVLSGDGGFLPRFLRLHKWFLGGVPLFPEQWISWIHIADLVRAFVWFVQKENLSGVFNLTAPEPVRAKEFFETLGRVLKRPTWLPYPHRLMKTLMGEVAREMLFPSQRVVPARLVQNDFQFQFPTVRLALAEIASEREKMIRQKLGKSPENEKRLV